MLSKMYPFVFLSFIFLSHCGLKIGEEAPPVSNYQLAVDPNYCSSLDYKKEFKKYFFHSLDKKQNFELRGVRFKKFLDCFANTIKNSRYLIHEDSLETDVYKLMLSEKYIPTEISLVKRLADKKNLASVLIVKNDLLGLIVSHQQNQSVTEKQLCHVTQTMDTKKLFSKEELDSLIQMLSFLARFSVDIESSSNEIYELFFNKKENNENLLVKSQDLMGGQEGFTLGSKTHVEPRRGRRESTKNLLVKSQLHNSREFQEEFIPFLIDYIHSGTLTKYTPFIKEVTRDKDNFLQMAVTILQFPTNSFDRITNQDFKYLLLNIFFTKIVFDLLDENKNQLLDQEELDILTCLLKPIVRFIFSPKLEGKSSFVIEAYTEEKIISYILKEKQFPMGDRFFLLYFKYWVDSANPISMSYADFSLVTGKLIEELVFSKKP